MFLNFLSCSVVEVVLEGLVYLRFYVLFGRAIEDVAYEAALIVFLQILTADHFQGWTF